MNGGGVFRMGRKPPRDPSERIQVAPGVSLTQAEAADLAQEYNEWAESLAAVYPVPILVRVAVRDYPVRDPADPERITMKPQVRLIFVQPTGPHVAIVTPEVADELAPMLTDAARQARTGLARARNGEGVPS